MACAFLLALALLDSAIAGAAVACALTVENPASRVFSVLGFIGLQIACVLVACASLARLGWPL